jgi:hypothetical protein
MSFAALVWDMATRPAEVPGTYKVLERYREYLDFSPMRTVADDIDAAITSARVNGAFTMFEASSAAASGRGDAPPSWHDAHALGLDGTEIIAMFKDTSSDSLAGVGIEPTFRGTKGPPRP